MNLKSVPILHEDNDILVVNKPAGLVVHSDGRTKEPTVVDWILANYPDTKGVGDSSPATNHKPPTPNSGERPGIVHRLDRETSGALLIAKSQTAFARLKKQFQRQQVRKTYHAFVYGSVKSDEGLIDRPIARSRANPVLWSATRGRRGEEREAVTEYRVLARLILPYQGEHSPSAARRGVHKPTTDSSFSFLELFPRTGRTHQIRVHLKAINYPIVCDKLYAPNRECLPAASGKSAAQTGALGFSRLALHSRALSFVHPISGERVTVEAPYPADFLEAKKLLETRNSNIETRNKSQNPRF